MTQGYNLCSTDITVFNVIREIVGQNTIDDFSKVILIPDDLSSFGDEQVPRAHLAMSLFIVLYADLLERVPHAKNYFERRLVEERTILFDHGAVRTVLHERNGALPIGEESLTRILEPLGYFHNHTYPLEKLKMTGRSYTHSDLPTQIPQYFVSEFHVAKVQDDEFIKAVINVTEDSIDPLNEQTKADLAYLTEHKSLPRARCNDFLANCAGAFQRQHRVPELNDYKRLIKHSAEMAWIATEGNAFNHATDRVEKLTELVDEENSLSMPMKETIEVSKTGRVLQTAYRADPIERPFIDDKGDCIQIEVPGSFFEFIERKIDPDTGELDLQFDASNATGIFKMTEGNHENIDPIDEFDQLE